MQIQILGIPMDLGAGRRGVDMGASALRNARLAHALRDLGHSVQDLGDIPVRIPETIDPTEQGGWVMLEPIAEACEQAYQLLSQNAPDIFPIVLGGDHSIAMGSVAGCARGQRCGLIWVDAHTDFNTPETSPSGNIHGMPVSHLIGLGEARLRSFMQGWQIQPEDIVMIGIRSIDPAERDLLKQYGIQVYTMKDLDLQGIPRIVQQTIAQLGHLPHVHLSFDADVLDPSIAPGVGTPVAGGLTYREAHLLMELFAESGCIRSLDLVEVNPILDVRNQTAQMMVGLTESLLGKHIY